MLTIHQTTNYDLFNFASGNRIITKENVSKRLLESIKEKNMLESHPILCDQDMCVIDGQNRLMCARILGIPIFYVIDSKVKAEDIPRCQIQNPWETKHFLEYYKDKKKDYLFVSEICLKYKLSHFLPFVIECCSSVADATRAFRQGKLRIIKDTRRLEENFKNICEIESYIKKCVPNFKVSSIGIKALWRIVNESNYKHSIMMEKIDKYIDKVMEAFRFKSRDHIENFMIENVYNRYTKNNEKLRHE